MMNLQFPSLTVSQRRMVMIVILCIIVLVAVILASVLRQTSVQTSEDGDKKAIHAIITERFSNTAEPHPKNARYNDYFKYFYSSGANDTSTIMFMPSVTDIACMNFSDTVRGSITCGEDEGSAPLDRVSVKDAQASTGLRPYEVCGSRGASIGPTDPQDALVRIQNSMYRFNKCCVQLSYISIHRESSRYTMRLPTDNQATLFMILTRPVFLSTNATFAYHVTLKDNRYEFGYSGDSYVEVELHKVQDQLFYDKGSYNKKKDIDEVYEERPEKENGLLNATIYYLSYDTPVRRGLSNVSFSDHTVMTLAFPVSKMLASSSLTWFSTRNLTVSYDGDETKEIVCTFHGTALRIKVGGHGYLIVVHATDQAILCYMSRGKVRLVVGRVSSLKVNSDEMSDIRDEAENRGVKPPTTCFPCSLTGIPDLYDMYSKLVAFS